jgi:hypothetical protein
MEINPLKGYVSLISSKPSNNFVSQTGNNLQIEKKSILIIHSFKFM